MSNKDDYTHNLPSSPHICDRRLTTALLTQQRFQNVHKVSSPGNVSSSRSLAWVKGGGGGTKVWIFQCLASAGLDDRNISKNRPVVQSVRQLINQSTNQSINQSINQSLNQSLNQSINQSINQSSINQ